MAESATSTRELRKVETARGLKAVARELTAERGLAGFTIDEVCERVGVSRRTFFNYFASKENAVIGLPVREADFPDAQFAAADPSGLPALLDDLAELSLARWELLDLSAADVEPLMKAAEREPRLIAHLFALAEAGEREDIELVERREGLPPGDLRAAAAVQVMGAITRASVAEFFTPDRTASLRDIVSRRLDAARELFGA